jgi:hypothetical protein
MAYLTDISRGVQKKRRIPRIMGDMAFQAGGCSRRTMGKASREEIGVTGKTKVLQRGDETGVGTLVMTVVTAFFRIRGMG